MKLTVAIVANPATQHQTAAGHALANACLALGDRPLLLQRSSEVPRSVDAVAIWSWHRGQSLRSAGHNVLVMERGYIGDRFRYTSLGWNGLNGQAQFMLDGIGGGNRFATHFPGALKPWKTPGRDLAVIMGQVPGDAALAGTDLAPWYVAVAQRLKPDYRRVLFRPHPEALRRGQVSGALAGLTFAEGDLADVLAAADLVVTWNSNSGVDAVLAGVPTVAMARGSMAWPVTMRDVSSPFFPVERDAWAERLAHCQWLPEEIEAGEPWARLRGMLAERKAA